MKQKIISITPADGWGAKIGIQDLDEDRIIDAIKPLVAWALMENEDGDRQVVGLICTIGPGGRPRPAHSILRFRHYVAPLHEGELS